MLHEAVECSWTSRWVLDKVRFGTAKKGGNKVSLCGELLPVFWGVCPQVFAMASVLLLDLLEEVLGDPRPRWCRCSVVLVVCTLDLAVGGSSVEELLTPVFPEGVHWVGVMWVRCEVEVCCREGGAERCNSVCCPGPVSVASVGWTVHSGQVVVDSATDHGVVRGTNGWEWLGLNIMCIECRDYEVQTREWCLSVDVCGEVDMLSEIVGVKESVEIFT